MAERTHGDMASAIARLHRELPGWWWSIGWCCISADASLSPDIDGPDTHLVYSDDPRFNEGFHHAYEGDDVADALHQAIDEALAAKAALTLEQVERAREIYARERPLYRRAGRLADRSSNGAPDA